MPPLTILIIKDQPQDLTALAAALDRIGPRVYSATRAAQGLTLARELVPAVILLDLHLPDADGLAVLAQLRAEPATAAVPVLIVTAEDVAPSLRQRLFIAGAADLLLLPISSAELATKVRTWVELQGQNRALREGADEARLEAAAALRESEKLFEVFFESIGVGHAVIDPSSGRFVRVNRRFEEITGYTAAELYGLRHIDITFPDDRPEELDRLQRFIAGTDHEIAQEKRYVRKDGAVIWVELTASVVRNADASLRFCLGVVQDVTLQKQSEMELRASQAQLRQMGVELKQMVADRTAALEQKTAQLEAFCYTVAHDLRSPLRAISGYADILDQDFSRALPAEGSAYLLKIRQSAERLDALIGDLLTYSQMSDLDMVLEDVPLLTSVEWAVRQLEPEVRARAAVITIEPNLPRVHADRSLLDQIALNFLSNALKFVPVDRPPRIDVAAEPGHGTVRLLVRDNGIGIAPEYHERIFRVFERLHDAPHVEGTGVGLAIVARGAKRMGGRVGVESGAGLGSTFWVELRGAAA